MPEAGAPSDEVLGLCWLLLGVPDTDMVAVLCVAGVLLVMYFLKSYRC